MRLRSWQSVVLILGIAVLGFLLYRSHQQEQGRRAFERLGCPTCHLAGGAPSLEHVGRKYDRATFIEWVTNPETVYKKLGRKPLNAGYEPMPRMQASHDEVVAISYFLSALR